MSCPDAAAFLLTIVRPNAGAVCGPTGPGIKAQAEWWPDGRVDVVFRAGTVFYRSDALHEAAHVIVGYGADHGPQWAAVFQELCAPYRSSRT